MAVDVGSYYFFDNNLGENVVGRVVIGSSGSKYPIWWIDNGGNPHLEFHAEADLTLAVETT